MLEFRLILLLSICGGIQAYTVPFLNSSEVVDFTRENENCLIGYAGFPECEFTNEFINQMEIAYKELSKRGVKVAVVNESVDGLDATRGPFSTLYRRNREPFRIDWLSDGHEIAQWVQLKLESSVVYEFKSKAEYDYFLKNYKTVFSAYLKRESERDFDNYKSVADEVNALFLVTFDETLANEVLHLVKEKIIVEHQWLGEREDFEYDFDKEEIKKWVMNQIQKTPESLTPRNARNAFSSKTNHIAILFVPKSDPNFETLLKNFVVLHKLGSKRNQGKVSLFYVETDNSQNKPLLEKFNVERGTKVVVFLSTYTNLAQIPFTKQCTFGRKTTLEMSMRQFDKDEMLQNYELHLLQHQLIY